MNTSQLDSLFSQYGYELKEQTLSYRVYLLHQGMYYGAEILMLDESDATDIQKRYSRLGYSAKIQHFANVKQAESYLFKGFFKTEYTTVAIQHRYDEFAQKQIKHYANPHIKYEITYDTIAHVLNYIEVGDEELLQLADGVLVEEMQSLFGPPKETK